MTIHHLRRRSDLNCQLEWLGSRRRHSRGRDEERQAAGADGDGTAPASKAPIPLTRQPEARGAASPMAATLERLAGRPGAAFLPKGTLRAIAEKAAAAGDDEARALLDSGALGDQHVEG